MFSLRIYQFLMLLALPLLLVIFFLRSLTQSAYRARLTERLGLIGKPQRDGIIFHAASVGEVIALAPLVKDCLQRFPNVPITVTTFTPTGSAQVRQTFHDQVQHCYIPFDNPLSASMFFNALSPRLLVIMETEIWPALLRAAKIRRCPVLLINGRLSQRSFPKYQKLRALVKESLSSIHMLLGQSDADTERFIALGADKEKVKVSGNIKYDLALSPSSNQVWDDLCKNLDDRPVWVVGSSHEDEEDLIFEAFKQLQLQQKNLLLILAPRHPERIEPVVTAAEARKFECLRRSGGEHPGPETNIWVIDTMGELVDIYRLASVVTVAGSFGATGGHNPLEAALHRKAIVVGPNMTNFQDINEALLRAEGLEQLPNASPQTLANAISKLLNDRERCQQLGENAWRVLEQNRGATAKTLQCIESLLAAGYSQ